MDENEKVDGVETETNTEVVETEESTDSPETKVEKPKESDEARRGRLQREVTRLNKKLGIEDKPKEPEAKKSEDVDYAQEAYLLANNIKEADEIELAKERMVETGKSLKEVVGNKYFQQDLKDLREAKSVKEALPTSSKRSSTSARDTVEYWRTKIANSKGTVTLLDIPDVKLRRQVLNAGLQTIKETNHFTDNPLG